MAWPAWPDGAVNPPASRFLFRLCPAPPAGRSAGSQCLWDPSPSQIRQRELARLVPGPWAAGDPPQAGGPGRCHHVLATSGVAVQGQGLLCVLTQRLPAPSSSTRAG